MRVGCRDAGILLAAGLVGLSGGAVASSASTASPSPARTMRADHMVLDVAIRDSTLLAATQSGRVTRYDWQTGERGATLLDLAAGGGRAIAPSVSSIAISPGGDHYAAVSSEGLLRVGALDGDSAGQGLRTYERAGLLIARFLDEQRLLLGDMRGQLSLFDRAQHRETYVRQLEYDPVFALSVAPDGRRVAVAFRSSRIHVVDVREGGRQRILRGHRDSVYSLAWLGAERLASGSKDKRLLVWDLSQAEPVPRLLYSGDHYIEALAVSHRGDQLAFTLGDHVLGLLRLADEQIVARLREHTAPVQVLVFADGDRSLISAGKDARIVAWSLNRAEALDSPGVREGRSP